MPWGAAVAGGIAAGGSLLSGILGSKASGKAAGQQSFAAQAAAMQQAAQYQNTENLVAPWVAQGNLNENDLAYLMGAGGTANDALTVGQGYGSLNTPYPQFQAPAAFDAPAPFSYAPYQAPTPFSYQAFQAPAPFSYQPFSFGQEQFQQSPGYQWQLQQGIQAAQNAASATGSPGGGNALRAIQTYGTGLANQDWYNAQNAALRQYQTNYNTASGAYNTNYDVALGAYGTNYNTAAQSYNTNAANALQAYQQNYGGAFQTYQQNYNNQFQNYQQNYNNQLANYQLGYQQNQNQKNQIINYLTGSSQLGANAALGVGQQGVQSASNVGNSLIQAGNAQAAGTVGSSNAINNAIGWTSNNLGAFLLSRQGQNLFSGGGPTSGVSYNVDAALANAADPIGNSLNYTNTALMNDFNAGYSGY